MEKKKITVKEMAIAAIITALICVVGPFTIPIGPVPISLVTFMIYLSVVILPFRLSELSVFLYILIGLIGIPVFSGFSGGFAKLSGPTGGYIIGYLFIPLIAALFIKASKKNIILTGLGLILGTAVLYAFGTAWFMFMLKCDLPYALTLCVYPFIPLDLVKIVLSLIIGGAVGKALKKAGLI